MTEAEWQSATDLNAMLEALQGEFSDSKLRLFACACCRRIWDLIDSDLHRRAVVYAEWFARGPGRDLVWHGNGHWSQFQLSWPLERIQQVEGWKAIWQELDAEQAGLSEEMSALRYDHWTPVESARSTLHLRYDMPWYVARGVAAIRTAPYAYWQYDELLRFCIEEDERWVARIDEELASLCGLLRDVYGKPNFKPASQAPPGVPVNESVQTQE